MARANTNTKKVSKKAAPARPHFAIRAIRNRNPREFRSHTAGSVLSRIFSL